MFSLYNTAYVSYIHFLSAITITSLSTLHCSVNPDRLTASSHPNITLLVNNITTISKLFLQRHNQVRFQTVFLVEFKIKIVRYIT